MIIHFIVIVALLPDSDKNMYNNIHGAKFFYLVNL